MAQLQAFNLQPDIHVLDLVSLLLAAPQQLLAVLKNSQAIQQLAQCKAGPLPSSGRHGTHRAAGVMLIKAAGP